MRSDFRQTLLTEDAYKCLRFAKDIRKKECGGKVSYSDVIVELMGKQNNYQMINANIRDYLEDIVSNLVVDKGIKGIVLFGSYARGNFTKYSDIDLFIAVDGDETKYTDKINLVIRGKHNSFKDEAWSYYPYISPLIVSTKNLDVMRPVFFDVMDYGIILFQRESVIRAFFECLRRYKHRRLNIEGVEVLTWKA
ncbi:MAG: nucleotidyltransferase domain-containing protein [Thermoplasmataceae archaeon]